jgi:hypothetical protein
LVNIPRAGLENIIRIVMSSEVRGVATEREDGVHRPAAGRQQDLQVKPGMAETGL